MSPAEGSAEALEHALEAGASRLRPPPELLGRARVPQLIGDALVEWARMGAFMLAAALGPAALYPLWALLIASRIHALGVLLHEAAHMPLRRMTPGLRLLELLAGYPLGSTLAAMRYHHLRHHRDTCMARDPYAKPDLRGRPLLHLALWLRTALIVPAWTLRGLIGSLALVVPPLRAPYARLLLQDRSGRPDLARSPEVLACARAELGQLAAHLGLLGLALAWPGPVFYYYVLPALLASLLCGWRLLEEHSYARVHDRSLASLLAATRDHNTDPVGRLLFAPRNIGYHLVHHLHPQVAERHLPALAAWYRAQLGPRYPAMREALSGRLPRAEGV